MRQHRNPFRRPLGFTLIELLVVIGIIGFLIAISGIVIGNMIGSAKEKATKATIVKIHELIMERRRGFDIVLKSNAQVYNRIKGQPQEVQIAFKKLAMRQSLPSRAADYNAYSLPTTPPTKIVDAAAPPWAVSTTADDPTTSSELLYFALTQGAALFQASDAADQFSSSEVMDTDGDGNMEFVDAWGNPLRFYLYPTRLFRPGGWDSTNSVLSPLDQTLITTMFPSLAKYELSVDPDDPNGLLSNQFAQSTYESQFHTPLTYQIPLVVSAGPDGELGLHESSDTANFGHLAQPITSSGAIDYDVLFDNITNYQNVNN